MSCAHPRGDAAAQVLLAEHARGLGRARDITYRVLTTAGDESAVAPAVRRAAAEVAPMVPLNGLESYRAAYRRFRASDYIVIGIFSSFALLAMVLAATGLYGVISFAVSQRAGEFGTRFALGAQVRDVIGLVLGQSLRLVGIGLTIGLSAGILLARAMQAALFDVTPFDAANLASVAGLLTTVAVVASVLPALRAARVDIVQALRAESARPAALGGKQPFLRGEAERPLPGEPQGDAGPSRRTP